MKVRIKYVVEDVDRHGNVRLYFWKKPGPKIRLRAAPGTSDFAAAYQAALEGQRSPATPAKPNFIKRVSTDTFRWLCVQYLASEKFLELAKSTRDMQRGVIDSMCQEPVEPNSALTYADVQLAELTMRAMEVLRDRKAKLPNAANKRLKILRKMMKFGVKSGYLASNLAREVEFMKTPQGGHHTWTIEEVRQFEARHPIGTRARLALALLLYTGVRRSDVVLLGRQMARNGWLNFTEQKGIDNLEKVRSVPILPQLQEIIDATPNNHLTYLTTEAGHPFTANGFGNWFHDRCVEAGVPGRAHGLRKAGATAAADNGATEHQLMAIYGWESPRQAETYTKKANRRKLAGAAMHLIIPSDDQG